MKQSVCNTQKDSDVGGRLGVRRGRLHPMQPEQGRAGSRLCRHGGRGGNPPRKPADQRDFENMVMTIFGVYVGLLVAEGTNRKPEMGALVQQLKDDQRPVSGFGLQTSAAHQQAGWSSEPADRTGRCFRRHG